MKTIKKCITALRATFYMAALAAMFLVLPTSAIAGDAGDEPVGLTDVAVKKLNPGGGGTPSAKDPNRSCMELGGKKIDVVVEERLEVPRDAVNRSPYPKQKPPDAFAEPGTYSFCIVPGANLPKHSDGTAVSLDQVFRNQEKEYSFPPFTLGAAGVFVSGVRAHLFDDHLSGDYQIVGMFNMSSDEEVEKIGWGGSWVDMKEVYWAWTKTNPECKSAFRSACAGTSPYRMDPLDWNTRVASTDPTMAVSVPDAKTRLVSIVPTRSATPPALNLVFYLGSNVPAAATKKE